MTELSKSDGTGKGSVGHDSPYFDVREALEYYAAKKKYTFESPNNFRAKTPAQKGLDALQKLRMQIFELEMSAALQNQQPSVNQQMLEALKGMCAIYDTDGDHSVRSGEQARNRAEQVITNAESSKPDPRDQRIIDLESDVKRLHNDKMNYFESNITKDAIIQKLKEGLKFYADAYRISVTYSNYPDSRSYDEFEDDGDYARKTLAEVEQMEKQS